MKILKLAVLVVVVLVTMKVMGLTMQDLLKMADDKMASFDEDTRALKSGEYKTKVANTLKEEALRQAATQPAGSQDEMHRELAEARRKMLEDRASALEQHSGAILRGDLESLKKQVAENAKQAGGGY